MVSCCGDPKWVRCRSVIFSFAPALPVCWLPAAGFVLDKGQILSLRDQADSREGWLT